VEARDRRLQRRVDTAHHSSSHAQQSHRSSVHIYNSVLLSEKEDEENFDLSLISSLESDIIPCLSHDLVPDYLITQLAKVLQQ